MHANVSVQRRHHGKTQLQRCHGLSRWAVLARAGTDVQPACSLPYACPEVLLAYERGERMTAQPAHDIWALGVHSVCFAFVWCLSALSSSLLGSLHELTL